MRFTTAPRCWFLLAGYALLCSLAVNAADPAGLSRPVDSATLFSTPLFDLKDQAANLNAYRGKPLIINFWARWCGPCKVEIPALITLKKRNLGVEVIGLNVERNAEAVRDFAYAYDINYPVYLTHEAGLNVLQSLGNQKMGLPFTVAINARGEVVSSHLGLISTEQLDAAARLATSTTAKRLTPQ